jgi:hypothetical protein
LDPDWNAAIAAWANFLTAEVGASAALTGLVVVAISINLTRILAFSYLPARAGETLALLVGALVLASVGLIPQLHMAVFGVLALAIGLVMFLVSLVNQMRSWRVIEGVSGGRKAARVIMSASATLPFVVGGALLIVGSRAGLDWIAAAVIVSLVAGVWNTWILLVEIVR